MSKGTLHKDRFEAIEAYLLGRMSVGDRLLFEQELEADKELREEMELQRENTLAVELAGLQRTLKALSVEHQHKGNVTGGGWSRYLKYAAAVVLVVTAALWFLARPSDNERLFAEHFTPDPGLPVAMGNASDLAFADAMVAYKLEDYDEASSKWNALLIASPGNDTLRYFIASAQLAMGNANEAIPLLEGLVADSSSRFASKARWYLLLAYVKNGAYDKAKALSFDTDPSYSERAGALKAQLVE